MRRLIETTITPDRPTGEGTICGHGPEVALARCGFGAGRGARLRVGAGVGEGGSGGERRGGCGKRCEQCSAVHCVCVPLQVCLDAFSDCAGRGRKLCARPRPASAVHHGDDVTPADLSRSRLTRPSRPSARRLRLAFDPAPQLRQLGARVLHEGAHARRMTQVRMRQQPHVVAERQDLANPRHARQPVADETGQQARAEARLRWRAPRPRRCRRGRRWRRARHCPRTSAARPRRPAPRRSRPRGARCRGRSSSPARRRPMRCARSCGPQAFPAARPSRAEPRPHRAATG